MSDDTKESVDAEFPVRPLSAVALVYTDEGPGGPCGQSCSTTSEWSRVYLFDDEDSARKWLDAQGAPRRKRARWHIVSSYPEYVGSPYFLEDRRKRPE